MPEEWIPHKSYPELRASRAGCQGAESVARVESSGVLRVQGSGLRVEGLGFRV